MELCHAEVRGCYAIGGKKNRLILITKTSEQDPIKVIFMVCEHFGWTVNEYMEQPAEILNKFAIMLGVKLRVEKREYDKMRNELEGLYGRG